MKIGIFGGAFNPPHIGHLNSSIQAAERLGLDRLIIIPTGAPPHKTLPAGTPSSQDRLHMTHLTFGEIPNAYVSDMEIGDAQPSYTIRTVENIKGEYPDAELFLLVGTDMYLTLDLWKDSEKLLSIAKPAVFSRNNEDLKKINLFSGELNQRYGVVTEIIDNKVVVISSSELRRLLPERKGARYINDTTYAYIIEKRLYGAKPDWDWLRGRAHSMLDPKRVPHVAGCEKEALKLAEHWGVDVDDAREAAILHDITKNLTVGENLRILESHGFTEETPLLSEEKLFHSKSGALLAKSIFGVSDGVADAIKWHTTGRAGMSLLEKVIYMADYIEPERDFEGVDDLRAAAYSNIDRAMVLGLEMSVQDMVERGIAPNKTTFDALDDLLKHEN